MSTEPGFEDQAPPAGHADWFLQYLVTLVENTEGLSFGITIQQGGLLVSGELVNERAYFEGFAEEFAATSGLSPEDRNQLRESFATLEGGGQSEAGDRSAVALFIHLRDARFLTDSGNARPAAQGAWWRGRLAEVRGFAVGAARRSAAPSEAQTGGTPVPEAPWQNTDVLEYTQDAIFIWEMHGEGILYWNRAAEFLYGYSRSEAIGRTSHELLKTQVEGGIAAVEEQLSRYGVWAGTLRHRARQGRVVPVQARLSLLSQRNGRWLVIEVNRDKPTEGQGRSVGEGGSQVGGES